MLYRIDILSTKAKLRQRKIYGLNLKTKLFLREIEGARSKINASCTPFNLVAGRLEPPLLDGLRPLQPLLLEDDEDDEKEPRESLAPRFERAASGFKGPQAKQTSSRAMMMTKPGSIDNGSCLRALHEPPPAPAATSEPFAVGGKVISGQATAVTTLFEAAGRSASSSTSRYTPTSFAIILLPSENFLQTFSKLQHKARQKNSAIFFDNRTSLK